MNKDKRNNHNVPFKKAKAKKIIIELPVHNYNVSSKERSELMVQLNEELIREISSVLQTNPMANLSAFEKIYAHEAQTITGMPGRLALAFNFEMEDKTVKSEKKKSKPEAKFPPSYMKRYGDRLLSDSYLALGSLFGINPLIPKGDVLAALLEKGLEELEEEQVQPLRYIEVKNVIKSKGNAINGPKREDVGNYNRKLFESYSKALNRATQNQLIVNVKFYPKYAYFFGNDKIFTSDFVQLYKYSGPVRLRMEKSLFVVHQKNVRRRCTLICEDKIIFGRLGKNKLKYSLSKCKRKIYVLYLETFMLYVMEFLCEGAACNTFNSFFTDTSQDAPSVM